MMRLITLVLFVTASPCARSQIVGVVEDVRVSHISGWAGSNAPTTRGKAVYAHFFLRGLNGASDVYLGSTATNNVERPDVASAMSWSGPWVGFSFALPYSLLRPGDNDIDTYVNTSAFADKTRSLGGPTHIFKSSANFAGPSPFGVVESIASDRVTGWACDIDGSGRVILDVYVMIDGVGSPVLLARGTAGIARGDIPCGFGFDIGLPATIGGRHSLFVVARNEGQGHDSELERHSSLADAYQAPWAPAFNEDPNLNHGHDCWQGARTVRVDGCPRGRGPLWTWSIFASLGRAPQPPVSGLTGPAARIRYDATPRGIAIRFNTRSDLPDVYPWEYNFQALQTNMPGVPLAAASSAHLQVRLSMGNERDWFYYDPARTFPGQCQPNSVVGCPHPWLHVIVAAVYWDTRNGNVYFLEIVPYFHHTTSPLGGIGGPPGVENARLSLDDPRLSACVNRATGMLLGESRTLDVDLRRAAELVWPNVPHDAWMITGGYVGTEQYGHHQVAVELEHLAFVLDLTRARVRVFGAGCPGSTGTPVLQVVHAAVIGEDLTIEVGPVPELAPTLLHLGASDTRWGGISLPAELTSIGMPGCWILVSGDAALVQTTGGGSRRFALPVPWDPQMIGKTLYGQCYVMDPSANRGGGVLTEGVELVVGGRE